MKQNEDTPQATVEGLTQGLVVVESHSRLAWLHTLLRRKNMKGKMSNHKISKTVEEFCSTEKMFLFCTNKAATLNIPAVDGVVQFDAPNDANDYLSRVNKAAQGERKMGYALLLLRPEEVEFLDHLKEDLIFLKYYHPFRKFDDIQSKIDEAMKNSKMKNLAINAFEGYIRSFEVKKLKHVFNLYTVGVDAVVKSFGLNEKPDVDIRK